MVLGHRDRNLICLKATSNTAVYEADPERMAGCVFYRAGATALFTRDTVIEPSQQFAVPYQRIRNPRQVLGVMPPDFHAKLLQAINGSILLSARERRGLLAFLGER